MFVLSVTILETTKTCHLMVSNPEQFYRSQFWRLQKPGRELVLDAYKFYRSQFWRLQKPGFPTNCLSGGFIGHNFGDYKNLLKWRYIIIWVLSVTILETTKTVYFYGCIRWGFYRSQFWRLQKHHKVSNHSDEGFIGHNFGDYKNPRDVQVSSMVVLSVTILETTKTSNSIS